MAESSNPTSPPLLPSILPIFPLDGVLLLPHGHLPLHVFEPRYREMVEAALGSGRTIGMIQPRQEHPHPIPNEAPIFEVGCAGRIVNFSETDDGRFLITLKGICRFRVSEELSLGDAGFRRVRPDFAPFLADLEPAAEPALDRSRLLAAAKAYLQAKNIACDWSAVKTASLAAIVTSMAMICPFEAGEKQALLESPTLTDQGNLLISLFEMALIEGEIDPSSTLH